MVRRKAEMFEPVTMGHSLPPSLTSSMSKRR
jgi:hypothetical protein